MAEPALPIDDWVPSIEDWQAFGQHFSYRGHSLFYRDEGSGDAIVCVHAFPGTSWDWRMLWPTLTRHFRVIAPDMLGHGFSDKPLDYAYSVADQADAIEALCQHLGVERVHLMAQGSGVAQVMELLSRQNNGHHGSCKIASLVLFNSSLLQDATETLTEGRLLMQLGDAMVHNVNSEFLGNVLNTLRGPLTKLDAKEVAVYWDLLARAEGAKVLAKLMHFVHDRSEHHGRWLQALTSPRVPVMAIIGDADPVWGEQIEEFLALHLPNIQVTSLPEIGHYPHQEDPDSVLRVLSEFLPGY